MYSIIIKASAEKAMERLPRTVYLSVKKRIYDLRENPRPHGVKKLEDDIAWRVRVGDYRVVYTIDDTEQTLRIVAVGHRQSVYRGRSR